MADARLQIPESSPGAFITLFTPLFNATCVLSGPPHAPLTLNVHTEGGLFVGVLGTIRNLIEVTKLSETMLSLESCEEVRRGTSRTTGAWAQESQVKGGRNRKGKSNGPASF